MKKYFVTGIGTGVGKTVCSAILVEALKADYWKPIQAGELHNTDTDKVKALVSNTKTQFYPEQFRLELGMSPHAAAAKEGIEINLDDIIIPLSSNALVIEGAGGVMVPINSRGDLIIDLISEIDPEVVIVSQNYLGSINHTLLTFQAIKHRGLAIAGIIFNGPSNPETEEIIQNITGLNCLGKIPQVFQVDKEFVKGQADLLAIQFS